MTNTNTNLLNALPVNDLIKVVVVKYDMIDV